MDGTAAFGDRVLSLSEAERISGLSQVTLRRLHKERRLKIIRLSKRRVGIWLSELDRFLSMTREVEVEVLRTPKPRLAIGPHTMIGVRWATADLTAIDEWRAKQIDKPGRAEAVRRLVRRGLG